MKAQPRSYQASNASPINGLIPVQLTRHVAVSSSQIMAALAVLTTLGAHVDHVVSHGAEQEIVARFPDLGTLTRFQRDFTE